MKIFFFIIIYLFKQRHEIVLSSFYNNGIVYQLFG